MYGSAGEAACELILSENGVLYQEPEFLAREELREPGAYFSILHSLASGKTKPNEIAQDSGVRHSGVNKYLETLVRMKLIERCVPITEKNPERSAKGIYLLTDQFLRFWFRYVFPNRSIIEMGKGRQLFEAKVASDLDNLMGIVYEAICRQFAADHGNELFGWDPLKIGRYWDGQREIDFVAEDAPGQSAAFVECKWGEHVHIGRILAKLRKKADAIPYYRGWKKSYYVMSRTKDKHPEHIHLG
jgi:AAA+ ATPase superfamily predicted ATPase